MSARFPPKTRRTAKEELAVLYMAASQLPLPEYFEKWLAELYGLRQAWHKAVQREKRKAAGR